MSRWQYPRAPALRIAMPSRSSGASVSTMILAAGPKLLDGRDTARPAEPGQGDVEQHGRGPVAGDARARDPRDRRSRGRCSRWKGLPAALAQTGDRARDHDSGVELALAGVIGHDWRRVIHLSGARCIAGGASVGSDPARKLRHLVAQRSSLSTPTAFYLT